MNPQVLSQEISRTDLRSNCDNVGLNSLFRKEASQMENVRYVPTQEGEELQSQQSNPQRFLQSLQIPFALNIGIGSSKSVKFRPIYSKAGEITLEDL